MRSRFPMWWVTQRPPCRRQPAQKVCAPPDPPPPLPPPDLPQDKTASLHIPPQIRTLLHGLDGDTVLILLLILLLRKEQADRSLLLALAYILM